MSSARFSTYSAEDDSFFYHDQNGELVVELKSSATQEALHLGYSRRSRKKSAHVALTRSASRCVLYHAPVTISENKRQRIKVPALTRILRSQLLNDAPRLSDEDWKHNRVEKEVVEWIESSDLEDKISFVSFDPNGGIFFLVASWRFFNC